MVKAGVCKISIPSSNLGAAYLKFLTLKKPLVDFTFFTFTNKTVIFFYYGFVYLETIFEKVSYFLMCKKMITKITANQKPWIIIIVKKTPKNTTTKCFK